MAAWKPRLQWQWTSENFVVNTSGTALIFLAGRVCSASILHLTRNNSKYRQNGDRRDIKTRHKNRWSFVLHIWLNCARKRNHASFSIDAVYVYSQAECVE